MTFTARSALRDLHDTRTLTHGLVSTAGTVALTLIEPRGLTPGRRAVYRTAVGVFSAWTMWAGLRTEVAAAAETAAAGTSESSDPADELDLDDAAEPVDELDPDEAAEPEEDPAAEAEAGPLQLVDRWTYHPVNRMVLAVGAGGAVIGYMDLHEAIDARVVGLLSRVGVERPRGTLAIAGAALSLGTWYLGRRSLAS
ncbi:hypothetical protein [Brachybacterium phenoliresistens]|uniref:hypothetical protein n=1 Tax=Brachybacterium phenoliresistens TaxID=396014 RepID=UPI0031DC3900